MTTTPTLVRPLLALACLGSAAATAAAPLGTIDQQNPEPYTGTSGWIAPYSYGQSFTAGLSAVDAFEFLLGGFEATTVVRVRDGVAGSDGLGGTILAESAPVRVDKAGSFWFHYDLGERLTLVPGQVYVAELAFSTGSLGVRMTLDNAYAGGMLLQTGYSPGHFSPDYDLVFREGLHSPVPEPAGVLLMMLGVAGVVAGVRQHHEKTRGAAKHTA